MKMQWAYYLKIYLTHCLKISLSCFPTMQTFRILEQGSYMCLCVGVNIKSSSCALYVHPNAVYTRMHIITNKIFLNIYSRKLSYFYVLGKTIIFFFIVTAWFTKEFIIQGILNFLKTRATF